MGAPPQTVIIGASAAGLAVARCLEEAGDRPILIEAEAQVGTMWRNAYRRLHLHTPRGRSGLPHLPMPASYPRYPSRQQVVDYLEAYAAALKTPPRFGVRATAVRRDGARWQVETPVEDFGADMVVIATGNTRVPDRPTWPGMDQYGGRLLHSADYRSGADFAGQRVLVVGFGNSGAEIALDLAECGAPCAISIRGAVNVVPREVLHVPITYLALASRFLAPRVADRLNALTIRLAIGDIARIGLRRRNDGPIEEIVESQRIPVVDIGTIAAMREGKIEVRPDIESFSRDAVRFVDGRSEQFEAVVLATGYETGLRAMFGDDESVLDASGHPRADARESVRGLYFCGFHIVPAGLIREIAIEAVRIGGCIAADPRAA